MAYVTKLFNTNFMEYASYVIKDRAIPHIIDGMKPVQRRILHSLLEMDDGKFHKVANVVGHCMKYHPHGDASIYSALVVLANKELFIDRQGNFGNIYTGDPASAARYIECRILQLAKEVLYNPQITEFEPSYDGRNKEPVVFPAKMPILLVHGTEGIAVGMSTKILPHNFVDVLEAVRAVLKGETFQLFPDFPTGGLVDVSAYEDGLGKVLVRAKLDTKDPKKIIIRELPFGTTTESLIASIENASRKGKIKIASINDYTTENVEIEIKLARGVHTKDIVDAIYAFTDCEISISVNCLVIKENTPTVLPISDIIKFHSGYLVEVLRKELKLEEQQLLDRLHARTLERIFIEERIYKLIEEKTTAGGVQKAVKDGFDPFMDQIQREITKDDVERLLKIPIRRISRYDINKARREMREIKARLKEVRYHLKHIVDYAIGFIDGIIDKYGSLYKRKTKIISFQKVDVREAAERNLKLSYDPDSGYLGYAVTSGKKMFDVSHYDRILVIRQGGIYSVTNVPEKAFIDKEMLFCGLVEDELMEKRVFSILYKNEKDQVYLKRCKIEKFILERVYELLPNDKCEIISLVTDENAVVTLKYKPKKQLRVLEEKFKVSDYLIKGVKAGGVRLSAKEIKSARFGKK